MIKIKLFFFVTALFSFSCFSQIDSIFLELKTLNFENAKSKLAINQIPLELKNKFEWYIDYKKNGNKNFYPSKKIKGQYEHLNYFFDGNQQFYEKLNDSIAYEKLMKFKNITLNKNDSILVCEAYKAIFPLIFSNRMISILEYKDILTYKNFAYDKKEKLFSRYYELRYNALIEDKENISSFKTLLEKVKKTNFSYLQARIEQFIGVLKRHFKKEYKVSNQYYFDALNNYFKVNNFEAKKYITGLYFNISSNYSSLNNKDSAAYFLNVASRYSFKDSLRAFRKISKIYFEAKKYDSAYKYLNLRFKLDSISRNERHEKSIVEISEKYKTAEKDKQILIEQQKKKQNLNLFYGSLAFLCLGGIITYLNLKNSKRKRLLAEQQQELEKQKNLTLLKEQEITTINAMIDGQEKERVRIAEDLHDNIGSVLATLKLHFENLKLNREKKHFNQEELYSKTEKLIDETYLKVRSIAHAKNAGVIANKGLLVAVKLMAEKISDANKIKIDVLDFGLDKRLENSLEIAVFRIIQELTTNIIKHANATHATINISQFDSNLNIIIEDNGKGFDVDQTKPKNGMGINSIQTRIQHLKGTFEVDSTIGKGTSIIIDIPILNT